MVIAHSFPFLPLLHHYALLVQHHGLIAAQDHLFKIIFVPPGLYEIYKNLYHLNISHYTVDAAHVFNQLFILFFTQVRAGAQESTGQSKTCYWECDCHIC